MLRVHDPEFDFLVASRRRNVFRIRAPPELRALGKKILVALQGQRNQAEPLVNEAFTRECGCPPREFRRRLPPS